MVLKEASILALLYQLASNVPRDSGIVSYYNPYIA